MNRRTTERNILKEAIGAIHREAGLRLDVVGYEVRQGDKEIDAIIRIPEADTQLVAEIKKWAPHVNLGAVIHQINHIAGPGQGILLADHINPKMGERLKEAHIQFIDTAGNAYINQPPVYIYIKGNKPELNLVEGGKDKTGRAFQPTGMRVVFAFLRDKNLINAPYRQIAEQAQVALGAVGWVIHDLVAQNFLLEGRKKNQREFANFDQLMNEWVEAYPHKLKAKHRIATFTTDDPGWWKAIAPKKFGARWGGEIAAAQYTRYLHPKDAVVYIKKEHMAKFLKTARLRKIAQDEQAAFRVDLIEPFWREEKNRGKKAGLVHPLVAYADLIETGDPRNLETANRIREEYLR